MKKITFKYAPKDQVYFMYGNQIVRGVVFSVKFEMISSQAKSEVFYEVVRDGSKENAVMYERELHGSVEQLIYSLVTKFNKKYNNG